MNAVSTCSTALLYKVWHNLVATYCCALAGEWISITMIAITYCSTSVILRLILILIPSSNIYNNVIWQATATTTSTTSTTIIHNNDNDKK